MRMCGFESRGCSEMTSCEPGRTRAYSEDLRWRIVWQREALGKKCKDVASNLGVDAATVSRVVTRTGSEKLDLC